MKFQKAIEYLRVLIKDSTKRAVFVYSTLFILTPLVFIYTTKDNLEIVLAELLGFLSFLAGGSVYESIKNK
jgi:hypothetical protein